MFSLVSCSDYLDRKSSAFETDGFFETEEGMEEGVTGVYNKIPYDMNWGVPAVMVVDGYTPYGLQNEENTTIGAGNGLTPDQSYVSTYWSANYSLIARANSVLDGAVEDTSVMTAEYRRNVAECKVLRAYGYFCLVSTFGNVPFFTSSVDTDEYNAFATDKAEITDYMINELQQVAEEGSLEWPNTVRGRVNLATCYALIARYGLLAGSNDFNGRGQEYFRIAADAAKAVMDNRGLATNYGDLFTLAGQAQAATQNEIIWEIPYINSSVRKFHRTRLGNSSNGVGGSTVRFASALLANTFECIDGKRIDESPLFDPTKQSQHRDPRFKYTIAMHGDTVTYAKGTKKWVLNVYDSKTKAYPHAKTGKWYSIDNTDVTNPKISIATTGNGYLWNKYNQDNTEESLQESFVDIIIMRAAEMYLTYAEAKIELGELDESVYSAINAVRRRAGMPDFDEARKGDQNKMRQIVRRETKVELAMEGVLFIDFRRWKIGDITNTAPVYGMPINEIRYEGLTKDDMPSFTTTERHDINDVSDYSKVADKYKSRDLKRVWYDRFYWWPIPRTELDRDPNLSNPEGY
jgi:hypothetical protein